MEMNGLLFIKRNDTMKASIILVTWAETEERMNLLKQTLDSLKKSTDYPYELIVIDNGPEEQTVFLKTQDIDKHIINKTNKGIGFGRNQGLDVAIGNYIVYIDNDLIFSKDWLKEGIELLEKYPDKKFIVSTLFSQHQVKGNIGQTKKYFVGVIDGYLLWSRGSPGGTIYRREDINILGKWANHTKPGVAYCDNISKKGYIFISLLFPKVMHRGIISSYNYKQLMKDGKWLRSWNLEI